MHQQTNTHTHSEEDDGIELQILSNAIGGGSSVPVDHSSRTSVEHHSQSDELSCANSAVSVDFPEQLASTIGMIESHVQLHTLMISIISF
jgi:hypothetical protein